MTDDDRRGKSAVAQEQRAIGNPRVKARRTHPECREYGQEKVDRQRQARPVLRYYGEDPTLRLRRVHDEKIQVGAERDEHPHDPISETCPDRSQISPRMVVRTVQEYSIPAGRFVIKPRQLGDRLHCDRTTLEQKIQPREHDRPTQQREDTGPLE